MNLKNKRVLIGSLLVGIIVLGFVGFALADVIYTISQSDGSLKASKSVRIQDDPTWEQPQGNDYKDGRIYYSHVVNQPFNIYMFITNNGQEQNWILEEATTFTLKLVGEDGTVIPITTLNLTDPNLMETAPISVTIPKIQKWWIDVWTGNDKYQRGAGQGGDIVAEVELMTSDLYDSFQISPTNASVNIGSNITYIASLSRRNTDGTTTTRDVTSECSWTSSNTSIAKSNNSNNTFVGVQAGNTTISARYGGTSGSSDGMISTTNLTVGGVPDHFAIVPYNSGDPAVPRLNIRSDTGPSTSTWGYIGEPMTVNVALQMQDANNNLVAGYSYNTAWFSNPSNWHITFTSSSGSPDPTKLSITVISVNEVRDANNNPVLKATLQITQNNSSLEKEFNDFKLILNPVNQSNLKLKNPVAASVFDANGNQDTSPYNLYGGRIKIQDNYFTSPTGIVNVFVEKYHNGAFISNTADSKSGVERWAIDGNELIQPVIFNQGKAQVTVTNNSSNKVILFSPKVGFYPSYFLTPPLSGTLTWGQIINNPPGDGTLWEQETPKENQ